MSENEEEFGRYSNITIATIRSTAKRVSCMRILTYLNNNSESRTIQEVSNDLGMDWGTAKHNLTKLMEAGFIEPEEDRMDGRTKYFKIADKKAVEKAIQYYKRSVGYKLAKFIPSYKITAEQLKEDRQFIEQCQFFNIPFQECIQALKQCPMIDYIEDGTRLILWRKEQYIPEKPKEIGIEEEEVE